MIKDRKRLPGVILAREKDERGLALVLVAFVVLFVLMAVGHIGTDTTKQEESTDEFYTDE